MDTPTRQSTRCEQGDTPRLMGFNLCPVDCNITLWTVTQLIWIFNIAGCLTLLQQILAEVDPQPPLPDNLLKLLDRLVNDRAGVLKQLGLHIVEGKEMINAVLNGGNPPPTLKNYEIVHDLQRISQYVRWVACNLLHNDYMSLAENKQKTFPSSTILSLLWTSIEDRILQGWTEHVLNNPNKPKHSLIKA